MSNLVQVDHPQDAAYRQKRRSIIKSLLTLSPSELDEKLRWDMAQSTLNTKTDAEMSQKVLGEITTAPYIPTKLKTGILDSTSGTTGNVLIRQDLKFGVPCQ